MNVKMRNVLLAALLVAVLTAGAASAGGWKKQGGHGGRMGNSHMSERGYGHRQNADRANAPQVPQEIRDKLTEARKTAIDLRTELGKKPVDRDKALELHAKRRALMQDISDWYFNQRLDALIAR